MIESFCLFMVRKTCAMNASVLTCLQSKLFDHDNMKYLKKLLDELEGVMDQVETELQRRVEETPGIPGQLGQSPPLNPAMTPKRFSPMFFPL